MSKLMMRAGNGQGSIIWLESKQLWRAKIMDGCHSNGKPNLVYFYSKKNGERSEVVEKLDEWKRKEELKDLSDGTLGAKIVEWLNTFKLNSLKSGSFDRIESTIMNHIVPKLEDYKPKDLTSSIIQEKLINAMMPTYSLSSIKKVYHALNEYMNHAVLTRELQFNPMLAVVKPNAAHFDKTEVNSLSDVEVRKLNSAVKATSPNGFPIYRTGYAYMLILYTGLRMGEALALKWSDVDLSNQTLHVISNAIRVKNRGKTQKGRGNYMLLMQDTAKYSSSNRTIPLSKSCVDALEHLMSLPEYSHDGYVITTKDGNPVHPAPFQKTLDRICERAGIEHFGIHKLRHTFASKMIERGVDIKVVSKILGHSGIQITYDLYVHIIDKCKKRAVDVVDFT